MAEQARSVQLGSAAELHNAGWSTQLIDHSPNLDIRSGGTGLLLLVGTAHAFEHRLALLIDKACEELLRVPKHQRPGKDLAWRVQRAEAGYELAAHEQQAEECGDGARW